MDDELGGKEQAEMDAWAADKPEYREARADLRRYRKTLVDHVPASVEPPYGDFFQSRVNQRIRQERTRDEPGVASTVPGFSIWKKWLMPAGAFAAIVLAFGIGRKSGDGPAVAAGRGVMTPVVYTPEEGVDAKWYSTRAATVIVLEGIAAIPDATDFSETVYVPTARESDRTATMGKKNLESTN